MIELYDENYLKKIELQKKRLLTVYFILLAVAVIIEAVVIFFNAYLPYGNEYKTLLQLVMYSVAIIFSVYSVLFFTITYGRVKTYYDFVDGIMVGNKKETPVTVIKLSRELISGKIDGYTLAVLEWSDAENDFVERTINIDNEKEIPDFEKGEIITVATCSNYLYSYSRSQNR